MKEEKTIQLTIVYDNNAYDSRLATAWGFSAFVEYHDHTLLFDTGADAPTLLGNMDTLGIDPNQIEAVVISHDHRDHTGGLEGLLERNPSPIIHIIPSYSAASRGRISPEASMIEVAEGEQLMEGVFTTGELGGGIPEQSLIMRTSHGLVILTGCAHPGIVRIVREAKRLLDEPVYLVLGGFHLGDASAAELESIVAAFRQLGVEKVAPCHCSGDQAIKYFAAEYKDNFIQAGVGKILTIDP